VPLVVQLNESFVYYEIAYKNIDVISDLKLGDHGECHFYMSEQQ